MNIDNKKSTFEISNASLDKLDILKHISILNKNQLIDLAIKRLKLSKELLK